MKTLTQATARNLFEYRNGKLVWNVSVNSRAQMGCVAGSMDDNSGYVKVQINGKQYLAHRIVWLWHHGYLPENQIDHINQNKGDNRIENLREVSPQCNQRNSKQRESLSGVKGVNWDNLNRKWLANIKIYGKLINLGRYSSVLEAACHRLAAEQAENWPGCDSKSPAFKYVNEHLNMDKSV